MPANLRAETEDRRAELIEHVANVDDELGMLFLGETWRREMRVAGGVCVVGGSGRMRGWVFRDRVVQRRKVGTSSFRKTEGAGSALFVAKAWFDQCEK